MIADSETVADSVKPRRSVRGLPTFAAGARTALSLAAQIAVLWSIDLVASAAVARFHIPVPGNVLGLALLFALLCSGIVKTAWVEPAATLLVKHLAFFFIPVTVGLLGMGSLFAVHGAGILTTLTLSAAVGMAMCGLTSQRMLNAQSARNAGLGSDLDV